MQLIGNVQLVAGDEREVPHILRLLEKIGFQPQANPDIEIRSYPQLLVEDARRLCERAASKPVQSTRRVFIIVTSNLTYEAQNTLLKTLEEPPADALFFFVVPAPAALLPTVLSRAQLLAFQESPPASLDVEHFLSATPQKRLDMLKPLLEKGDDDPPTGGRDMSGILAFLAGLERSLARASSRSREGLEAVYRARKYATDKGSMLKSLLEQVALLVPRV